MGILDALRLDEVDEGNLPEEVICKRIPASGDAEIKDKARLRVWPNQEAVFVSAGQITTVFGPGEYNLDLMNLIAIGKLAEGMVMKGDGRIWRTRVHIVNTNQISELGWGGSMNFNDPIFTTITVLLHGTVNLQVTDSKLLVTKLMANSVLYRKEDIQKFLRPIITNAVLGEMSRAMTLPPDAAPGTPQPCFANIDALRGIIDNGTKSTLVSRLKGVGIELLDLIMGPIRTTPEAEAEIAKYRARAAQARAEALATREKGFAEADAKARLLEAEARGAGLKKEMEIGGLARGVNQVDPARAAVFGHVVSADAMKGMAAAGGGGGGEGGGGGGNPAVNQGLQLGMAMMVPGMMQGMWNQQQMQNQPQMQGQPAAPAGDSLEVRLEKLKVLKDKGLITPEQYEAKKQKILDEL